MVIEEVSVSQSGEAEEDPRSVTAAQSPRRQEQRGGADRAASDPALQPSAANPEASPPAERPVERKSYSLARRTRSRPADLGSKQASVEESAAGGNTPSPAGGGGKNWAGEGDEAGQTGGGGVAELDQAVAQLNLARRNWSPNQTSFVRSEMRGESVLTVGSDPVEPVRPSSNSLCVCRSAQSDARHRRPASVSQHGGDERQLQPSQAVLLPAPESCAGTGAAHAPGSDGRPLLRAQ